MRTTDKIDHINCETKKHEIITREDITIVDWGFHFYVKDEPSAYKAVYHFRNSKGGVKVSFAGGVGKWMVTVFNEDAPAGIDRS